MTSVAERKRKRRGRKRIEGVERTASGRISRAKPQKLEPIPEQIAKREALGLAKGDELDCAIVAALRAGEISPQQREELDRLRALHRAMMRAIDAPGLPADMLARYQPRGGGEPSDATRTATLKAWAAAWWSVSVRAGPEAQRAIRALIVDNRRPARMDLVRVGLRA